MASFLNATAVLTHVSPLPAGVTRESAIEKLQHHVNLIECDPHMTRYEIFKPDEPPAPLPSYVASKPTSEPVVYRVTDKIHTLPAGLWDSDVVSTSEFVNLEDGVFARLKSPLSVLMETIWSIRTEGETLELVETVNINCSRLLVGVVKSQCENNWQSIHAKLVTILTGKDEKKEAPAS